MLLHALLAFPTGRLGSPGRRALAAVAYLNVLALQALASVFDPLTRYHSAHPRNLALVDARSGLATALLELEAAIAIALALTVAVVLATADARRDAGGPPPARAACSGAARAACSSSPSGSRSSRSRRRRGWRGWASACSPRWPCRARSSRSCSGAAVACGRRRAARRAARKPEASGLEDALRRALGDPSLELVRRPASIARSRRSPATGGVVTPILHQGAPAGALVHDRSLRLRPELLDAVGAAAGFALANEAALETVRRFEARNRALLDAIPDLMFRIARGRHLPRRHRPRHLRPGAPAGGAARAATSGTCSRRRGRRGARLRASTPSRRRA